MGKSSKNPEENPLHEFASEMSSTLGSQPVELRDSSADKVEGGQVWMKNSSARSIQANAVHLEQSATASVRTDSLDAHDSAIAVAVADDITLTESSSSVLAAQDMKATDVRTVFLVAGRVEGEVTTLLTPLTALLSGIGVGLTLYLLRRLIAPLPFMRKN